jgi:hypothetical protein
MFKLVFGLVAALLFSTPALAQLVSCTQYRSTSTSPAFTTDWNKAPAAVQSQHVALINAAQGLQSCADGGGYGNWVSYSAGAINGTTDFVLNRSGQACAYGLPSGAPVLTSSTVTFASRTGDHCEPTPCIVGEGYTFNRTEAWSRTPELDAPVLVDLGPPSTAYGYDDGVCVGNLLPEVKCWKSQTPSSQGLYRASCEYTMVVTGDTAGSPTDANTSPSTANASCPGAVGTVNGKTVCVGTSSNPLPTPTDPPNAPTGAGNPPAGTKPTTGTGSGSTGAEVTPTTGSGGNSGGPASAAIIVGGGSGEPGEPGTAVCGAPPLPSCNVKVDETGTPAVGDAPGKFTESNAGVDEQKGLLDGMLGDIEDYSIGDWTWTFSLPTGCTAFTVYEGVSVDPCAYQETFHDLMSVIWVLTGICAAFVIFEKGSA